MIRKTSWLAAVVVLTSNAAALGMAWVNRSGTPEAVIELTEREARLVPRDSDNTSITLRLAWINPRRKTPSTPLLGPSELANLGFDVAGPVTSENAGFYRGQAPRTAYAAFEFEGEAWRAYLASFPNDADRDAAQTGSHLVLIDVASDPRTLRARHPDRSRVLITRATVGLSLRSEAGRQPVLYGTLNQAYPIELAVPSHLRAPVAALAAAGVQVASPGQEWRRYLLPWPPRYRARVAWGRALEPWLVALD